MSFYIADYLNGLTAGTELSEVSASLAGAMNPAGFTPISGFPYVAALGHSVVEANSSVLTNPLRAQFFDRGPLIHACALAGQRVRFDPSLNFGVGGNTIAQAMVRVPNVIASGVKLCLIDIGTNDLVAAIALADMQTGYMAGITQLLKAGIRLIVMPILPRNDTAWNALSSGAKSTARRKRDAWNRWLYALCRSTAGMEWVNCLDTFTDWTTNTADNPAGSGRQVMAWDNLHPSMLGAYWIGRAIADILIRIAQPLTRPFSFGNFNLSENPSGNIIDDPFFNATGGSASTGASGTIASGWTIGRLSGDATCVCSIVTKTLANGLTHKMQQIALTGGAAASTVTMRRAYSVPSFYTAGTPKIYSEVDVEVDAGVTGLTGLYIEINEQDGSNSVLGQSRSMAEVDTSATCPAMPDATLSRRDRSPPYQSNADAVNLLPQFVMRVDPAAAVTVSIRPAGRLDGMTGQAEISRRPNDANIGPPSAARAILNIK